MIPPSLHWLFWEVDPHVIDLDRHRDYVLLRVMERGDWTAMQWLVRTFSKSDLADVVARKGGQLPPRERAFWSLIAGLPRVTAAGGGRPPWAD